MNHTKGSQQFYCRIICVYFNLFHTIERIAYYLKIFSQLVYISGHLHTKYEGKKYSGKVGETKTYKDAKNCTITIIFRPKSATAAKSCP
ncbi:unnamed protein product [Dicrocoelium dendriticum]|nr:unnamed protein product [Dicrocoelium dendriticum]